MNQFEQYMAEQERLREEREREELRRRLQMQAMIARQQGQQQQQGGGPNVPPGMISRFMGGGGAAAGGAGGTNTAATTGLVGPQSLAVGGGAGAGAGAGAGGGGAGGGGAGGGAGSALGAAGPWGALAAIILANEWQARKAGRRPESKSRQFENAFTGESIETDMTYYGKKIGGPGGKMTEITGKMSSPKDTGRILEKSLKPWEWW